MGLVLSISPVSAYSIETQNSSNNCDMDLTPLDLSTNMEENNTNSISNKTISNEPKGYQKNPISTLHIIIITVVDIIAVGLLIQSILIVTFFGEVNLALLMQLGALLLFASYLYWEIEIMNPVYDAHNCESKKTKDFL